MSDRLERELATMLRDRAFGVGFDTDVPDDLGPRVRHARTRRNVMFGAAIAAVLLVAGGSAAALVDRGGRGDDVRVGPPTTLESGLGTVVGMDDGRIVELNADGSVGRELLADATEADERLAHVEIAEDGSLWYLVVDQSNCGRLMQKGGGDPQLVMDDVVGFALSPDGGRAVGVGQDCETGEPTSEIVVFDEDGLEQNRFDTGGEGAYPLELAWSPDGSQLAVATCFEGCRLKVVDPTAVDPWASGVPLGDGNAPAWVDGLLWFHMQEQPQSDLEGTGPGSVYRFDPETNKTAHYGKVVGELWITEMAPADSSLLVVATDPEEPPGSALYRWDMQPGAAAEPVRDGVVAVATSNPSGS